MTDHPTPEFWRLLDETRPSSRDPESHADALMRQLTARGAEAALAFARDMDAAMSALYSWDLWGAAYLALGGCSDDAFEYLRAWIIGNGEGMWTRAQSEPEALFIDLEMESRLQANLGPFDLGEHLLYSAGRAYESLTGGWPNLPRTQAPEPHGEPWDESDLATRFPELFQLVEPVWQSELAASTVDLAWSQLVAEGLDAAATGHHGRAEEILRPLFDDPEAWAVIARDTNSRVGVAYVLGIGDLMAGRVDRAGETFRRVIGDIRDHDELRRGLAQVELARGDLEAATKLLDPSPEATRFDRILCAKLAWRKGDSDEAVRRAREELVLPKNRDDHPWDVAGAILQAGQIFADAGLEDDARRAVKAMKPYLRGAPSELELVLEWRILQASVERLRGRPEKGLGVLEGIHAASGYAEASWHREASRTLRSLGRSADAEEMRQRAVQLLTEAGELWEAGDLQA